MNNVIEIVIVVQQKVFQFHQCLQISAELMIDVTD